MRQIISILIAVILITLPEISVAQEKIRIGVIASLSGTGAQRGESARQGIELARKVLASKGTQGREIELIYEDVALNDAKRGPVAFNKLVDANKVTAIIGPMGSTVALAVAPLASARKVPIIVHTASTMKLESSGSYAFRLWATADQYAAKADQALREGGYKRVAVISALSDNTQELKTEVEKLVSKRGEKFLFNESVTPDTTDFKTLLLKIKALKPDLLFLNLFEGQLAIAAKQARAIDIKTQLFGSSLINEQEVAQAEGALEGVIFPRYAGYPEEVKKQFLELLGQEPSVAETAVAAAEAYLIVAQATSRAGADREQIRKDLSVAAFDGLSGKITFSESRNATVPVELFTVRSGQVVLLQ